jgi:hypothetical protein
MITKAETLRGRMIGGISFVITLCGALLFTSLFALGRHTRLTDPLPGWFMQSMNAAGIGLLVGFLVSLAGLVFDTRRGTAVVSLVLSLAALFLLGETVFQI